MLLLSLDKPLWVRVLAWSFLAHCVLVLGVVVYYALRQPAATSSRSALEDRLQAERLLDEAWDLMGGEIGTNSLDHFADERSLELARRKIRDALLLVPGMAAALGKMGTYLRAIGRYEESEALLRRSVAEDPSDWAAHNNLGITLAKQGKLTEAQQAFEEALRRRPRESAAEANLANVHLSEGRVDDAVRLYTQAQEHGKSHVPAMAIGVALGRAGRQRDAIAWLERAVAQRPSDPQPHFNLAVAWKKTGDLKWALEHYLRAADFKARR